MFIPIGVDCGLANLLKKYNLRSYSFPFDWAVSYNGVSKCIEDNFKNFFPCEKLNNYDMSFPHDFSAMTLLTDIEKYNRRVNRLKLILENSQEPIYFIRKGHASHLHMEHNGKFTTIKSDIEDANTLDSIIKEKYPNLSYTITVFLVCGKCFNPKLDYTENNINIVNIVTPGADDILLENTFLKMFPVKTNK